jgi:hypothetical protein
MTNYIDNYINNFNDIDNFYDIDNFNDIIYVHFNTIEKCNLFIHYVNSLNRNINIGYRCCQNKGCGIKRLCKKNIDILINEFNENIETYIEINTDICNICYEVKILIHRCNTYQHPFCSDCLSRLNNCPLCRNPF